MWRPAGARGRPLRGRSPASSLGAPAMRRAASLSRLTLVAAAWLAGVAQPQVCDAGGQPPGVWPRPRSFRASGAFVPLDAQFHVRPADASSRASHWGHGSVRREAALRFESWLRAPGPSDGETVKFAVVDILGAVAEWPDAETDYSYNLTTARDPNGTHVRIRAQSAFGASYALETLAQLARRTRPPHVLQDVDIFDAPANAYRGLLVDVARHWLPPPLLLRTIDAMAAAKLNVLHLHLTDSQSFPVALEGDLERLARLGAFEYPLQTYTTEDLERIVDHARLRGVRVVPEVDVPAHTLSWARAFPSIVVNCSVAGSDSASASDVPALDPTKAETYAVVFKVLRALSEIFPDEVFHVGADEVRPECWRGLSSTRTAEELKSDFVARIARFVRKDLGKTPVVWQDALESATSDLMLALVESRAIVEVWKCWGGLAERAASTARRGGLKVIDAACRYLDWPSPWKSYHAPSKVPEALGGEAAMWTEDTDWTNFECRAWPRAAVTADALWGGYDDAERSLGDSVAAFTDDVLRSRLGLRAARVYDSSGETGVGERGACPALARSTPLRPPRPRPSVAVAALNFDDGGHGEAERLAKLAAWMRFEAERGTVVLALTELNGWERVGDHGETLFQRRAADAGFAFTSLLVSRDHPYHLGVASAAPIRKIASFGPPDFERGALLVETGGLYVLVVHLHAHDAAQRLGEARLLVGLIAKHVGDEEALVVVGDLNTLSPSDAASHASAGVVKWLSGPGAHLARMRRKYVDSSGHLAYGPMDLAYGPMAALLASGLVDACRHCAPTEPTGLLPDAAELDAGTAQLPLRVDYALASASLAKYGLQASVQNTDARWSTMSDHFAIRLEWTPKHEGGGEAVSAQRPLSFFHAGPWLADPWRPPAAHADARGAHAPGPRRGELTRRH
ncbi:glycoside hydrolase superfamily [Pelagophyceae sp. CCMP2097]|nr:glycoside hydrolase superfamily [Pelagophyceae sp. CCMP2097]